MAVALLSPTYSRVGGRGNARGLAFNIEPAIPCFLVPALGNQKRHWPRATHS
jgi:hypothetical protein